MKCDKCGFTPNLGDQICMNCGAKLSVENSYIPGVDTIKNDKIEKKKNTKIIIITTLGIIIIAIIIFIIIKYVIL